MKNLAFVIASFAVTIICWGIYGPVLHWGQEGMSTILHGKASLRPFICVGLAYFGIGVAVPTILLQLRGEAGEWTLKGILFSLAGGALGALGALGIILAFYFGGKPFWVMPLVFGGAPVVNSFLTIFLAGKMKEIGPVFIAGLIIVILGATTVLFAKPNPPAPAVQPVEAQAAAPPAEAANKETLIQRETTWFRDMVLRIASIALVICCWGAYGPVLHIGQAAMHHSRLRPLICVGLAYFGIAVVVGYLWLAATGEASEFNIMGTFWSLMGGAAGAIGALGIIMAFNFGGKPVYVMPLVFGGAPVVNTFFTITASGLWDQVNALFVAGLLLVIAGAAMVLVFAPKGSPPPKPPTPTTPPIPTEYPGSNPPS